MHSVQENNFCATERQVNVRRGTFGHVSSIVLYGYDWGDWEKGGDLFRERCATQLVKEILDCTRSSYLAECLVTNQKYISICRMMMVDEKKAVPVFYDASVKVLSGDMLPGVLEDMRQLGSILGRNVPLTVWEQVDYSPFKAASFRRFVYVPDAPVLPVYLKWYGERLGQEFFAQHFPKAKPDMAMKDIPALG